MRIVCLKYGNKFSYKHVNRLYKMVKRNFKDNFNFYCHTENPIKINKEIQIKSLPKEWESYKDEVYPYWVKLHALFDTPTSDTTIYFDLDIVIQKDITHLTKYCEKDKICIIKAYWKPHFHMTKPKAPHYDMDLNASVMIWTGDCTWAWNNFKKHLDYYALIYNGTDPYLYIHNYDNLTWLPKGEVYSRLYGYDENNFYHPYLGDSTKLFYNENYNICIFNGWKRKKKINGSYALTNASYKGFEKYWND